MRIARYTTGEDPSYGIVEGEPGREGSYRFLTTGEPDAFRATGSRFLQLPIGVVEHVTFDWGQSPQGTVPRAAA